MNGPELKKLIELLDSPDQLKLIIEKNRAYKDLDKSVRGFIEMYDSFDGDCSKLKNQINSNKRVILQPIQQKKTTTSRLPFLRYAAMITIIVASSLFTWYYFNASSFQLTQVYQDPGFPTYMSAESENSLESIMFFYRKKEYEEATKLLDQAICVQPKNDTLIYFSSLINHLNDNNKKAIIGFEKLCDKSGPFKLKSIYFLGVCLVEQGEKRKALRYFKYIVNSNDEILFSYAKKNLEELEKHLQGQ
jgi:tetratricopeptide (TPR) repeat protein